MAALQARLRRLEVETGAAAPSPQRASTPDDAAAEPDAPAEPGETRGEPPFSYEEILGRGAWSEVDPAVAIDRLADAYYAAQARRGAEEIAPASPTEADAEPEAEAAADATPPGASPADETSADETSADETSADETPADEARIPPPRGEADVDGVWRQFEAMLETANETLGRREPRLRRPARRPEIDYFPRPSLLPDPPPSMRAPDAAPPAGPMEDAAEPAPPVAPDPAPDAEPPGEAPTGAAAAEAPDPFAAEAPDPVAADPAAEDPVADEAGVDPARMGDPAEPIAERAPAPLVADDEGGGAADRDDDAEPGPPPSDERDAGAGAGAEPERSPGDAAPAESPAAAAAEDADWRNGVSDENRKRLDRIQTMVRGAIAARSARPKRAPRPPNPVISAMISGPGAGEDGAPADEPDPVVEAAVGPDLSPGEAAAPQRDAPEQPSTNELVSLLRGGLRDVLKEVVREELAKARDDKPREDEAGGEGPSGPSAGG